LVPNLNNFPLSSKKSSFFKESFKWGPEEGKKEEKNESREEGAMGHFGKMRLRNLLKIASNLKFSSKSAEFFGT